MALLCLLGGAIFELVNHSASHASPHRQAASRSEASARSSAASRRALRIRALRSKENRAIDRVLSYTPFIRYGGRHGRDVALTFDDGPGPYTPGVVRVLRRMHAPGTFFEVGFLEQWFHSSTRRIVADGLPIGDHTQIHPKMGALSPRAQRAQLLDQASEIRREGAPFPRLFRPPFGSFDADTFRILRRLHMLMVLWTVDTSDYARIGPKAIVQRALAGARPGAIILMHDGGGDRSQTITALPYIIRRLRSRHYHLVTVPRLVLDDPPPHHQELPTHLAGD